MENQNNTPTQAQRELMTTIDLLEAKIELAIAYLEEYPTRSRERLNNLMREHTFAKQRLATAIAFGI